MDVDRLAPDEPLSPELVLVFSAELRAQAVASLGPPAWPEPRPRAPEFAGAADYGLARQTAPSLDLPRRGILGLAVGARIAQLGLVFVVVTILTLGLSLVAHALNPAPQLYHPASRPHRVLPQRRNPASCDLQSRAL